MPKTTNHLNLDKKQLQNALIHKLANAPSDPVAGQIYYNTTSNHFFIHNGTAWQQITGQSMTANEILTAIKTVDGAGSGLDADLLDGQEGSYYMPASTKLNSIPAPDGSVSLNTQKITNLGAPTANSTDAATTQYVDEKVAAYVRGLDPKESVYGVVDVPDTLSGSNRTINGVFFPTGVRALVMNQPVAANNGIYTVSEGAWQRTADATVGTGGTLGAGAYTFHETTGQGYLYNNSTSNWQRFDERTVISAGTGINVTTTGTTSTISVNFGSMGTPYNYTIPRKLVETIGDGTNTSFTIVTGLNNDDVVVSVKDAVTHEHVLCDISTSYSAMTGNRVVLTFADAPATNQYKVVIIG